MALLLDTRTLPAVDRIEATNAALADTDVPAISGMTPLGSVATASTTGTWDRARISPGSWARGWITGGRSNCALRPRNGSDWLSAADCHGLHAPRYGPGSWAGDLSLTDGTSTV